MWPNTGSKRDSESFHEIKPCDPKLQNWSHWFMNLFGCWKISEESQQKGGYLVPQFQDLQRHYQYWEPISDQTYVLPEISEVESTIGSPTCSSGIIRWQLSDSLGSARKKDTHSMCCLLEFHIYWTSSPSCCITAWLFRDLKGGFHRRGSFSNRAQNQGQILSWSSVLIPFMQYVQIQTNVCRYRETFDVRYFNQRKSKI